MATANRITSGLQVNVSHEAWISSAVAGAAPSYAPAVSRPALVEKKQTLIRPGRAQGMPGGEEVMQQHLVTFIGPIPGNGADGRQEPIDPRDRITLPDGSTGPILDVRGLTDPATNGAYLYQVSLG